MHQASALDDHVLQLTKAVEKEQEMLKKDSAVKLSLDFWPC